MLRRRANATAVVTGETGAAALRLGLIVLEHEKTVRAQLERGVVATQRLIGVIVTPRADAISCLQAHLIERAHRGTLRRATLEEATREALTGDTPLESVKG